MAEVKDVTVEKEKHSESQSMNDVNLEDNNTGANPAENMADELEEENEKEEAKQPPEPLPPRPEFTPTIPECRKALDEADSFLNSDELRSKKNSKDNYMNRVESSARTVSNTLNRYRNTLADMDANARETAKGDLKACFSQLVTDAGAYVQNKHPWFRKGKRRKARVQRLYNAFAKATEREFLDVCIKVLIFDDAVSGVGTEITEDSEPGRIRAGNRRLAEAVKTMEKEQYDYADKLINKGALPSEEKRGGGRLALGLKEAGGYSEEKIESDISILTTLSKSPAELQTKINTYEAYFDVIAREDIEQYMFNSLADLSAGDIRRKRIFLEMIWEGNSIRDEYEALLLGTSADLGKKDNKGKEFTFKYDAKALLDIEAKIYVFQAVVNILRSISDMLADKNFDKVGPKLFKMLSAGLKPGDLQSDVDSEFYEYGDDYRGPYEHLREYTRVVLNMMGNLVGMMEDAGFGPGSTKEEALKNNRDKARERMLKRGFTGI